MRVISIPAAAIKSGEVLENTNVIPFPGASPDAAIHAAVAAQLQAAAGEHVPQSELLWLAAHAWKEWRLSRSWPDEAAYVADLTDHTALMRRAMETQAAEQIARGEDPLYKGEPGEHHEQAFRDFARDNGVILPQKLAFGKIQRFDPEDGGRKNDKGWCVFRGDFGVFGIWGTDIEEGVNWFAKKANGAALTEAERQAQKKQIDAAQRQYDQEKQRQHKEAAKKARDILDAATPAPDNHPYLLDKCVTAHGLKLHDGKLVMPLQDEHGVIWSYQTIDENGDKRFPLGGRKSGLFYVIGGPIPFDYECVDLYRRRLRDHGERPCGDRRAVRRGWRLRQSSDRRQGVARRPQESALRDLRR